MLVLLVSKVQRLSQSVSIGGGFLFSSVRGLLRLVGLRTVSFGSFPNAGKIRANTKAECEMPGDVNHADIEYFSPGTAYICYFAAL